MVHEGFPVSSVGKESTCKAGDSGSISGSGRSTREEIGYPLQYSWASLVAELVKNLPAMWETWIGSLCWEDPLEKGKATHSSILAWRIPWTVQSMGMQRVGHNWVTFTFFLLNILEGHCLNFVEITAKIYPFTVVYFSFSLFFMAVDCIEKKITLFWSGLALRLGEIELRNCSTTASFTKKKLFSNWRDN